jgi:hypothetical protein
VGSEPASMATVVEGTRPARDPGADGDPAPRHQRAR